MSAFQLLSGSSLFLPDRNIRADVSVPGSAVPMEELLRDDSNCSRPGEQSSPQSGCCRAKVVWDSPSGELGSVTMVMVHTEVQRGKGTSIYKL